MAGAGGGVDGRTIRVEMRGAGACGRELQGSVTSVALAGAARTAALAEPSSERAEIREKERRSKTDAAKDRSRQGKETGP